MPANPVTGLDVEETLAVGALLAAMQRSNLPIRRPSVHQPPYWGQSFVANTVVPVPVTTGPGWVDLLVVPRKPEHYIVITGFTLATLGAMVTAGLAFRFLNDEAVMTNQINIPAGIDLNRITPTTWPSQPRKMRLVLPMDARFALQYRNTSGIDRYALCAIFGYYANAKDASVIDAKGITDA